VIVCEAPSTVATVRSPRKFWTIPCETKKRPNTIEMGSSTRMTVRVRSTQKFPIVALRLRTSPRMRATATAIPTAADTKFWTASPAIWVKNDIVDSPE
jgi:hypothetical protein